MRSLVSAMLACSMMRLARVVGTGDLSMSPVGKCEVVDQLCLFDVVAVCWNTESRSASVNRYTPTF